MVKVNPARLRHMRPTAPVQGAFGQDRFGKAAERFARFFGTPTFVLAQSAIVLAWIVLNAGQLLFKPFDPFPYVLLNLAFSTQAAYAAPLILLAQTRQADRDKATAEADTRHREEVAQYHGELLQQNTDLTERVASLTDQVAELTKEIHGHVTQGS